MRTQFPTTTNYTVEFPTFREIAGASTSRVQWISLALGKPPLRSWYLPFAHFLIGLFIFLEWSHVSSLYILGIKPLSETSLSNIFSHIVGSLFILLMFSFLFLAYFIDYAFTVVPFFSPLPSSALHLSPSSMPHL